MDDFIKLCRVIVWSIIALTCIRIFAPELYGGIKGVLRWQELKNELLAGSEESSSSEDSNSSQGDSEPPGTQDPPATPIPEVEQPAVTPTVPVVRTDI